ncbi:MAG: hypothetical protein R2860_11105 [Desulfobacterales bacterium]
MNPGFEIIDDRMVAIRDGGDRVGGPPVKEITLSGNGRGGRGRRHYHARIGKLPPICPCPCSGGLADDLPLKHG